MDGVGGAVVGRCTTVFAETCFSGGGVDARWETGLDALITPSNGSAMNCSQSGDSMPKGIV